MSYPACIFNSGPAGAPGNEWIKKSEAFLSAAIVLASSIDIMKNKHSEDAPSFEHFPAL